MKIIENRIAFTQCIYYTKLHKKLFYDRETIFALNNGIQQMSFIPPYPSIQIK